MSLVRLQRLCFAGLLESKDPLIADLQTLGCVQVVPLRPDDGQSQGPAASAGAHEALRFLKGYRQRRRQVKDPNRFDAERVEQQVLDVRRRIQDLEQERDFLIRRRAAFEPWGDFCFPDRAELGGRRLWFYPVPVKDLPRVAALDHVFEVVNRDQRFAYLVVVAEEEPADMPVPRVHLGGKSRNAVEDRLDEVELAIEDAEAERAYLSRWYELFRQSLNRLEDRAARLKVATQTYENAPAFALSGWAPAENIPALAEYARGHGLYFNAEDPGPDDRPPSFLRNPSWLAAGEDLVNFYMTPGYRTWDPSAVVFLSFALFFGMILSDAGYASLLGALLLLYWRRWGGSENGRRYRSLGLAIVCCSLAWGALIGSWFGVEPEPATLLGHLHLLDMADANQMMGISVIIGCLHVILANVIDAWRHRRWQQRVAPLGWALVVAGGLGLGAAALLASPSLKEGSIGAIGAGLLAVALYSEPFAPPLQRLLGGLKGLTEVSRAFGDVLSYLRLFALGMAGASLAMEFNHMAAGIQEAVPGGGLFLGLLLLLVGHGLNIVIGIAAAVIHGLRLNVIEFFNWALKEEGTLFRPFRKREGI